MGRGQKGREEERERRGRRGKGGERKGGGAKGIEGCNGNLGVSKRRQWRGERWVLYTVAVVLIKGIHVLMISHVSGHFFHKFAGA